jgi:hypothetical protein
MPDIPETNLFPTAGECVGQPTAPTEEPLSPLKLTTLPELVSSIKRSLVTQAYLPDDAAELVAFWVISTWFFGALDFFPCLVITGPAHDASRALHVLHKLCFQAALLAEFRRSELHGVFWSGGTNLISEPNLDKRTANLLGHLTDKSFWVVEDDSRVCYAKSTAIYAGESPDTHKILNSIHVHMTPTNAEPPHCSEWFESMVQRIPVQLQKYRDKNLHYVRYARQGRWTPAGLSSETVIVATELGRCILDAPELRRKLVALLKTQDQQRRSEMSDTTEAIVLEATRALSRDGREHAYAREIAIETNRRLEARGETIRLNPEKVGHRLKKLGLRTRPLSQTGHGLTFDRATLARIEQLAAVYMVMEDMPAEADNLHG